MKNQPPLMPIIPDNAEKPLETIETKENQLESENVIKAKERLKEMEETEKMFKEESEKNLEMLTEQIDKLDPKEFQKLTIQTVFDMFHKFGYDKNTDLFSWFSPKIEKLLNKKYLRPELCEKVNKIYDQYSAECMQRREVKKIECLLDIKFDDNSEYVWWKKNKYYTPNYKLLDKTIEEYDKIKKSNPDQVAKLDDLSKKRDELEKEIDSVYIRRDKFTKDIYNPAKEQIAKEQGIDLSDQLSGASISQDEMEEWFSAWKNNDFMAVGIDGFRLKYDGAQQHIRDLESNHRDSLKMLFHSMGNTFNNLKNIIEKAHKKYEEDLKN